MITIDQQSMTVEQALAQALTQHTSANIPDAEKIYQAILQVTPDQPVALHHLGVITFQAGEHDDGIELVNKAIAINQGDFLAYNSLGVMYAETGQPDDAIACYQKTLEIKPDQAASHYNLGNVFNGLEKFEEAVSSYRNALKIEPDNVEMLNNLGITLSALGIFDEAKARYEKALTHNPESIDALYNLGVLFLELKLHENAIERFQQALAINPDHSESHNNLGNAFKGLERWDDAVQSYQKAIASKGDYAEAHSNLGVVYLELERSNDALDSLQEALTFNPDHADVHNNLGNVYKDLGRIDEAVASFRKSIDIKSDFALAHSNLVYTHQYLPDISLTKLQEIHAEWDMQHSLPLKSEWRDHENLREPHKTLRVGLVSSNFHRHPVGYFIVRFLENVRSNDIEIYCYSDSRSDDMADRLRAGSDHWFDVHGISDDDLDLRIRSDRIDILIDLAGHMNGNRLLLFARKPAPLQVKWVGYAGSVGLSAMDYLIADFQHLPEGVERYFSERVIRLPDGYVCYEPPVYAPDVSFLPYERNGFISFASFNNPAKLNRDVLKVWSDILKAVSHSRLILKYRNMNAEGNRKRIYDHFDAQGIEQSRVILENRSPHIDLLERYNNVDIALDTFPYTGGLTTVEAVWMGVPVITKPGETFASRHSLSHLTNIGVPELIAENSSDYVAKAVNLAMDIPRLSNLRSELRAQMAKSPLCDGAKFAADFTAAMQHIWKEWCLSQSVSK